MSTSTNILAFTVEKSLVSSLPLTDVDEDISIQEAGVIQSFGVVFSIYQVGQPTAASSESVIGHERQLQGLN